MNRDTLEQDPCNTCGYEEGSIYCKEHCPHEAKIKQELTEFEEIDFMQEHKKIPVTLDLTSCGDAIDRRLVCAFIDGLISDDGEREKGLEYIRNMPPVNPTKTGHWIYKQYGGYPECGNWHCSECDEIDNRTSAYCPNCGCRMVEPQERSDKE